MRNRDVILGRDDTMETLEYVKPSMEVIILENKDIVTTSSPDIDGGEGWI